MESLDHVFRRANWRLGSLGKMINYMKKFVLCVVAGFLLGFVLDTLAATASELVAAYEKPDIHLTWNHANQRLDGSTLNLEEINGYKIYYSHNGGPEQVISLPPTTSYTLTDVESGNYAFQISTIAELEGPKSNPVAFDVPLANPLFPTIRATLEICNAQGDCITQEVVQ